MIGDIRRQQQWSCLPSTPLCTLWNGLLDLNPSDWLSSLWRWMTQLGVTMNFPSLDMIPPYQNDCSIMELFVEHHKHQIALTEKTLPKVQSDGSESDSNSDSSVTDESKEETAQPTLPLKDRLRMYRQGTITSRPGDLHTLSQKVKALSTDLRKAKVFWLSDLTNSVAIVRPGKSNRILRMIFSKTNQPPSIEREKKNFFEKILPPHSDPGFGPLVYTSGPNLQ